MTTIPTNRPPPARTSPQVTAPDVTRSHVLAAVRTGVHSLAAAPWTGQQADQLLLLLREALAMGENGDDGTQGRAAPAIRAACAHLAARQSEDAYLALLCAQERFGEF